MLRILVVEDDALIREALVAMLTSMGYEVVLAKNGHEALARQLERPADGMLTDLCMPEMDGMETIQQIRKMYPKVKIVAMSGRGAAKGEPDLLGMAQRLGARQTLQKPFTMARLQAALQAAGLELS